MPGNRPSVRQGARTLFDDADARELRVPTSCRRTGRCRECIVEVLDGAEHLAPPTEPEAFLREPYRLACQAVVEDEDAEVSFEILRRRLRIVAGEPEPAAGAIDPVVRLVDGTVFHGHDPIGPVRGGVHGIALDIGTTTLALQLVDLQTGEALETVTLENPQRFGGSDVMNRISYDEGPGKGELRRAVRKALNEELRDLYARRGMDRRDVYEIVAVGNSTMRDLFFGLDVSALGQRPYKSSTERELLAGERRTTALGALAHELGIYCHPKARIWSPPLVGSHVGADVAADLVAVGLDRPRPGISMLVDVGTNSEVVVAAGDRIVAASCPAGPAFEGGLVEYAMQAADGAIERVRARPGGGFDVETIGGGPPQGLCGSGLIDLLAELRRTGFMTPKGQFADRARVVEVVPERGITLSRADASALAQAKAANTVGQWILLRALGIAPAAVDRLFLAGGFATYVDVGNAIAIGFLAPVRPERVHKVGNASLRGARELLVSAAARRRVQELVGRIEHIELETTHDFFELFVDGCQFKPIPSALGVPDARVAV